MDCGISIEVAAASLKQFNKLGRFFIVQMQNVLVDMIGLVGLKIQASILQLQLTVDAVIIQQSVNVKLASWCVKLKHNSLLICIF